MHTYLPLLKPALPLFRRSSFFYICIHNNNVHAYYLHVRKLFMHIGIYIYRYIHYILTTRQRKRLVDYMSKRFVVQFFGVLLREGLSVLWNMVMVGSNSSSYVSQVNSTHNRSCWGSSCNSNTNTSNILIITHNIRHTHTQ